ncbi:MAG: RimK family alpha-L-glutamate ligase, partial [Patescibacteria group bacterium]
MNIGILIFSDPLLDKASGFVRLVEAGQALGHTMSVFYETLFAFEHTEKGLQAYYDGKPFFAPNVMIARPNFVEEPMPHATTLEALKQMSIPVLNGSPEALIVSKDKLTQHLRFKSAGLPMPPWAIVRAPAHALEAANRLGFPVIMKVPFGTHGKGVFYATDSETFLPMVEYLNVRDGNPLIIEKFISEANRRDLRVLVLHGKIVAAMERTARAGDVRANASLGGSGTPVELSAAESALALKATEITVLDLAGVDILRSANGPLLIEI